MTIATFETKEISSMDNITDNNVYGTARPIFKHKEFKIAEDYDAHLTVVIID